MTPDRGYRTSVRRLLVASWVLAVVMFVVSLAVFDRFPFAGVIAGLLSIGCLRMAAEVHDEIHRWKRPVPTYRDQIADRGGIRYVSPAAAPGLMLESGPFTGGTWDLDEGWIDLDEDTMRERFPAFMETWRAPLTVKFETCPTPPARATSLRYRGDRYERDVDGTWRQVEWG